MATFEELTLRVKLLEELAAKDTSREIQSASARASAMLTAYQQAIAANQAADADRIAKEIVDLTDSASQLVAHRTQPRPATKAGYAGMLLLAIVFLALGWFLYRYAADVGLAKFATIEGTRPLLVIAAVISTIAFGGALLLASLFSSEGS